MAKFQLAAAFLLMNLLGVHAATLTDLTWVGDPGADFSTAANWSPAKKPSSDHCLIFTGDATPVIHSEAVVYAGRIIVQAGTISVTTDVDNGRCILREGSSGAETVTVDVATGASITFETQLNAVFSGGVKDYVKTGGGSLTIKGGIANNNGIRVEGGLLAIKNPTNRALVQDECKLVVSTGATFKLLTKNAFATRSIIDVAEGGTFDLGGLDLECAAVVGSGLVKNGGTLTLNLYGGPYAFDGKMSGISLRLLRYGGANVKATTEEEFGFIIGATDTLDDITGTFNCSYDSTSLPDPTVTDPRNSGLRFAPGIGIFRIATANTTGALTGNLLQPLYLEDQAGKPVTVIARSNSTRLQNYVATAGSGNFYVGGEANVNLRGSNLGHTGALGGAFAGEEIDFGDASSSANDFDFSRLSTLDATTCVLVFKNKSASVFPGQIIGSQTVKFTSEMEVGALNTVGAQINMTRNTTLNGGHFISYSNPSFNFVVDDLILTLNGGEFSRPYAADSDSRADEAFKGIPTPHSALLKGSHNDTSTVVMNGGDLYAVQNGSYGPRRFSLNGGALHLQTSPYKALPGTTAADPTVFALNGGEIVVSRKGQDANVVQKIFEEADELVVKVGANGAKLTSEMTVIGAEHHFDSPIAVTRPFAHDPACAGADGGLRQRGFWTFRYDYPLGITGDFVGEGGASLVSPDLTLAEDNTCFGSGNTVLRNHSLKLLDREDPFAFCPHGAEKKLVIDGAALLALRTDRTKGAVAVTATDIEFKPGSVLFLHDHGFLGAGSSTFKLATAPQVLSNGRVNLPVFGTTGTTGGNGSYLSPVGYSAENGFTNLTAGAYSGAFAEGALVNISEGKSVAVGVAAKADAIVATGGGCSLSLGAGASLTLGNGSDVAICQLSSGGISGEEGATLSFGTSPALIVSTTYAMRDCASFIDVPITAANGLTVAALPDIDVDGWRGVRLTKANTYSGVTRLESAIVQAEHANCFSAGDVYAEGGDKHAGGIRFNKAGAIWRNNFHLTGRGIRATKYHRPGDLGFSMQFAQDGEVAGDIAVGYVARVGTSTNENVKAVLSGTISGGKLELTYSKGWLRLTGANTYTDGTDVIQSNVEVSRGDSLGSGEVWLVNGKLRFVNEEPVVFSNYVKGVGTIELAGAPVTFEGEAFAALPVRTLAKGTVLRLASGYPLQANEIATSTIKTALVADGDLALAGDTTVDALWGSGTVSGGVLTVTDEIKASGTLTFAEQPVLTGATLVVATGNGEVSKVVVPDDLDLTGLKLAVEQVGLPVVFSAKAFLETSGELSGSFATVTLPTKKARNYSVDIGASAATLGYSKPGCCLIVR